MANPNLGFKSVQLNCVINNSCHGVNYINPLGYLVSCLHFLPGIFMPNASTGMEVDSALLERCKWRLLFHLFTLSLPALPREVPEPENHFIREMLHAWSLETSPHHLLTKHFQSDFLNLGFLLWVELWELGKKGKQPFSYRENKLKVTKGCALRQLVNPLPLS